MHDPSSSPATRPAVEPDDAAVIASSRHEPDRFSVIFDRYFTAIHRYAAARPSRARPLSLPRSATDGRFS